MPDKLDPTIPNGVIIAPKPEDYVEGDGNLAGLSDRVLLTTEDWTPYVPKGERQSGNGFDTNDCTAFAYTNVIETQFPVVKDKLGISQAAMKFLSDNGYLDEHGVPNFSDRALGSMAGTTSNGNSLNKVADTARKGGLIPESKWPSVFTNYSEYYKPVPQQLLNLGQQFLQFFDLPYEQTYGPSPTLKAAPLYVALRTCDGWSQPEPPPIPWCNVTGSNHAVELLKINDYRIFDSYPIAPNNSFIKDLATNYQVPYLYRVLLIPKNMNENIKIFKNGSEYIVGFKAVSPAGLGQQLFEANASNLLNADGSPNFVEIDKIAHVL